MTRLITALAAVLLASGCATAHLPNAGTGRCYSVRHAYVIGWIYWVADGIDGWRCKGIPDGELAKTGDRP